ncbi:uncharacterized protein LOC127870919 isoform X2 [Dreissena polymorpha]|uniref:uncharacterized protein LOC127870919 isoform X2 n=1 Tax=Dreissena polymorpha TaxID=45954 RepID=UPI002263C12B|nr:uncharacterized protein LOC127870919 isoform X2 [Dreissena polymorpha]
MAYQSEDASQNCCAELYICLQDALDSFNNSINEEQAWAVFYLCAQYLEQNSKQEIYRDLYYYGITAIQISKDGDLKVEVNFSQGTGKGPPSPRKRSSFSLSKEFKTVITEQDVVQALGTAIYKALNFGLSDNEEPDLSPDLEVLIEFLTDHPTDDDEGIDIERDSDNDQDSQGRELTVFQDVINRCIRRLSSQQNAQLHYKAVCRALATEASELTTFLDNIKKGHAKLVSKEEPSVDDLERSDWARLWVQIMRQLRHGVRLKKVDQDHLPPVEFELTPFEILLEDIRLGRFKLNRVSVNASIPPKVKDDAHAVILDFIRSRPPLKPVSRRKLNDIPVREMDPREKLMSEIRNNPVILKPVKQGKVVVRKPRFTNEDHSDEEYSPPAPTRKIIKPVMSFQAVNDFTLVSTDDSDSYVSETDEEGRRHIQGPLISPLTSPDQNVSWQSAVARDLAQHGSSQSRAIGRRHTISACDTKNGKKVSPVSASSQHATVMEDDEFDETPQTKHRFSREHVSRRVTKSKLVSYRQKDSGHVHGNCDIVDSSIVHKHTHKDLQHQQQKHLKHAEHCVLSKSQGNLLENSVSVPNNLSEFDSEYPQKPKRITRSVSVASISEPQYCHSPVRCSSPNAHGGRPESPVRRLSLSRSETFTCSIPRKSSKSCNRKESFVSTRCDSPQTRALKHQDSLSSPSPPPHCESPTHLTHSHSFRQVSPRRHSVSVVSRDVESSHLERKTHQHHHRHSVHVCKMHDPLSLDSRAASLSNVSNNISSEFSATDEVQKENLINKGVSTKERAKPVRRHASVSSIACLSKPKHDHKALVVNSKRSQSVNKLAWADVNKIDSSENSDEETFVSESAIQIKDPKEKNKHKVEPKTLHPVEPKAETKVKTEHTTESQIKHVIKSNNVSIDSIKANNNISDKIVTEPKENKIFHGEPFLQSSEKDNGVGSLTKSRGIIRARSRPEIGSIRTRQTLKEEEEEIFKKIEKIGKKKIESKEEVHDKTVISRAVSQRVRPASEIDFDRQARMRAKLIQERSSNLYQSSNLSKYVDKEESQAITARKTAVPKSIIKSSKTADDITDAKSGGESRHEHTDGRMKSNDHAQSMGDLTNAITDKELQMETDSKISSDNKDNASKPKKSVRLSRQVAVRTERSDIRLRIPIKPVHDEQHTVDTEQNQIESKARRIGVFTQDNLSKVKVENTENVSESEKSLVKNSTSSKTEILQAKQEVTSSKQEVMSQNNATTFHRPEFRPLRRVMRSSSEVRPRFETKPVKGSHNLSVDFENHSNGDSPDKHVLSPPPEFRDPVDSDATSSSTDPDLKVESTIDNIPDVIKTSKAEFKVADLLHVSWKCDASPEHLATNSSPTSSTSDFRIPASHKWQNPIECLSLTLEEVIHIRTVLTKAELESLIMNPDLYTKVGKGKICFTCKKTEFKFFKWGTKCKFCGRSVCNYCLKKMSVPTEHFEKIPVYTLSPVPLSPEVLEALKVYESTGSVPHSPATDRKSRNEADQQINGSDSDLSPASKEEDRSTSRRRSLQRSHTIGIGETRPPPNKALLQGPQVSICCDCKSMVMEIIRASRSSVSHLSRRSIEVKTGSTTENKDSGSNSARGSVVLRPRKLELGEEPPRPRSMLANINFKSFNLSSKFGTDS